MFLIRRLYSDVLHLEIDNYEYMKSQRVLVRTHDKLVA